MPLSIARKRQWLLFVVLVGIIALMSACASQRVTQLDWCPVPEKTAQLEYDLPPDSDGRKSALAKALDDAVCLVQTGKAEVCKDPPAELPVCDFRREEDIRKLLKPAFDAIASLKLERASSINDAISKQLPHAKPTRKVRDARRDFDCMDWKKEKPCVAFKYDILWFFLKLKTQDTGIAERIEIFLAEPACRKDIR
jgi:hypothetical protein